MSKPKYITASDAGKILGVSRQTVSGWCASKPPVLASLKIGNARYPLKSAVEFLKRERAKQ